MDYPRSHRLQVAEPESELAVGLAEPVLVLWATPSSFWGGRVGEVRWGSPCIAHSGLELANLLPQPAAGITGEHHHTLLPCKECWDCLCYHSCGSVMSPFLLQIPTVFLMSFLEALETGYGKYKNPYHNQIHAADVTQTVHCFLLRTGMVVGAWLCFCCSGPADLELGGLGCSFSALFLISLPGIPAPFETSCIHFLQRIARCTTLPGQCWGHTTGCGGFMTGGDILRVETHGWL